ncbi:MAG: alpha/beta fold hydrolase, partial [Polyangiaceae bacterium]|nr:alpha/beta fold hydrolase [Polyangiaceae bacterium]
GGEAPDGGRLRAALAEALPDYLVPQAIVALAALPLTAHGKLDRKALPPPGVGASAGTRPGPRDERERAVFEAWAEVLGRRDFGVEEGFFDAGGDSLRALRVLGSLRASLGLELPVRALLDGASVRSLARSIDPSSREGEHVTPLVRLSPPVAGRRAFFCAHPVTGTVSCLRPLAEALRAGGRALVAFRAPGLEPGEVPPTDLGELAAGYLAALRREQPAGPYLLGGYSLGGAVAFEMARRLEAEGERALLWLLDAPAPGALERRGDDGAEAADGLQRLLLFVRHLGWHLEADLRQHVARQLDLAEGASDEALLERLRALDDEQQLEALVACAEAAGLAPDEGGAAYVRRLYAVHGALLGAFMCYAPGRFGGEAVQFATRASAERAGEPTLGWGRHCARLPRTHVFDEDHASIASTRGAAAVAPHLLAAADVWERGDD